jgi:NADH:ubiquinone oxidoreductase subunit K
MEHLLTISVSHYLVLAAFVFCCGLYVMTIKRNAVGILIGVELILNAANINLIAFSRYQVGGIDGQIAALFVIVLAAAEAAIAIAIFVNYYNNLATIDVDRGDQLQG